MPIDDSQIKILLDSYGLASLLEISGVTEEFVLRNLVEQEYITLGDYFDDDEE